MIERLSEEELADRATEIFLKQAISVRKTTPKHTGFCLYCGAAVKEAAFCDADCSEDYEFINKRR